MLESMRVATTPAKCAMSVRVGPKLSEANVRNGWKADALIGVESDAETI